jgi:hypothetical protein
VLGQARETSAAVNDWILRACRGRGCDVFAAEFPQVYRHRNGPDPNDLLGLAAVLGGIRPLHTPGQVLLQFSPHDWKGSIDGDVMIERVRGCLSAEEHGHVILPSARSLQHNVFDGIGVGLHALSRLKRKREYPR